MGKWGRLPIDQWFGSGPPLLCQLSPLTTSSSVFTFQGCLCSLSIDDIFSNIFYSSIFFFIFLLPHNIIFSSQGWPGYQSFIKCIFLPYKRCGSVFSINKIFLFQKPKVVFFIGSHLADSNQSSRWIKRQKLFSFEDEKVLIFIFIGSNLADGKASSLPSVSITSTKLCSFGRRENKNIFHSKQIFFFLDNN